MTRGMSTLPPVSTPERAVILTAVDGSAVSVHAARAAARFATLPGSEVHLFHVLDASDGRDTDKALKHGLDLLERVALESGLDGRASLHLGAGTPWKAIVQLAADLQADLIVVGAHDLAPVEKLVLGSVSRHVVQRAGCPVYVARVKNHLLAAPEIEPPCPACVEKQFETRGKELWCANHKQRHVRGRLHYEMPEGYGAGSALLRG